MGGGGGGRGRRQEMNSVLSSKMLAEVRGPHFPIIEETAIGTKKLSNELLISSLWFIHLPVRF